MTVVQKPKTLAEVTRDNLVDKNIEKECVCTECEGHNCSLSLQDARPGYLLINLDPPCPLVRRDKTRCDFLFIGKLAGCNAEWIIPIELKSGHWKVEHLIGQLQAGAKLAEKLIPITMSKECSAEELGPREFRPILAFVRFFKGERQKLRSREIKFYGRSSQIYLLKCGGDLANGIR